MQDSNTEPIGYCPGCEDERTLENVRHIGAGEIRCEECDGRIWASGYGAEKIVEWVTGGDDGGQTPQEEWEEHNESYSYDPPEKPADAWSSEEYQELIDRVISRQVQWFCDKCSGRGPIRSLQKARSHVESQHSQDLVEQHATPREELETATDGGESDTRRREKNNQSLTEWSE